MTSQISAQLTDELDARLVGPVRDLLGLDLAETLTTRLRERAPMLAAQLATGDDRLAAATRVDVLHALWGDADPDSDWWRTPVGRLCARSVGRDDADAVSHSVAAAMLGVTRGTVSQLVHRGTLDRHPDGGVTRASVLMRLAR